jgi:hypothetical protein
MTHQMTVAKLNEKNALYVEIKGRFETIKATLLDPQNQFNYEDCHLVLREDGNIDFRFFGRPLIILFVNCFEAGQVIYSKANEKNQPSEEIVNLRMDRLGNFGEPYNMSHAGEYFYVHCQIMAAIAESFTETP